MSYIILKTMVINAKYGGVTQANICMATYATNIGTPALFVRDPETDEPLWTLSSNMAEYRVEPDEFCTFFKTYAENEGLLEQLAAEGLITPTGRSVGATHVTFPEVKIHATDEQWEQFRLLCKAAANS